MKKLKLLFFTVNILFLAINVGFATDISNSYFDISSAFDMFAEKHEGESSFRSLLIPSGGRFSGLGSAFTALSNDASFFDANPAGSALLSKTEIICLHNNWIADSKLETINYTQRKKNLGWGGSFRCFYVPFTEYGFSGTKKSSGYYSESFLVGNISYNFLAGYDFKGIAIGANLKMGLLSMPPFSGQGLENESLSEKKKKQKSQRSYAVLGDLGIIIRANLFKKFYDEEPNFYFGLVFKNFGVPIRGDIPPAYISIGFAYRPVSFFLFSLDVRENINLKNIKSFSKPEASLGMMFSITKYFNLLSGFGIRGGNPHFNLGGEINLKNIQLIANYTLDLSNQTTALNKISIGAKISLGDGGRSVESKKIKKLYIAGLKNYKEKKYLEAIKIWQSILEIDSNFDPAIEGIKIAITQQKMQKELDKILLFE